MATVRAYPLVDERAKADETAMPIIYAILGTEFWREHIVSIRFAMMMISMKTKTRFRFSATAMGRLLSRLVLNPLPRSTHPGVPTSTPTPERGKSLP